MNRKQLAILVGLVVVVGGISIMALKGKRSDWSTRESNSVKRVVADFPVNDVGGIVITTKDGSAKLTRKDDGWVVSDRGDYAADFNDIQELLVSVLDMEPVQKPKVGASNLGRLKLLDPEKTEKEEEAATRVVFEISGGGSKTLYLGKEHMRQGQGGGPMGGGSFPDGRYVMVGDDLESLSLVQATFASVNSDPTSWLSKDFFKIEKIKSIQYRPLAATNGWSLSREKDTGDFALQGAKEGETLDTSKTGSLKYLLSSPSFVDVAVGKTNEETGLGKPVTATIETFEGFKYDLSIGKKDEKDQYFINFAVDAKIEKDRKPGEDEKPEDKAKLDKEHQEKVKKLEDKLAAEKKLAGKVYIVSKFTVDALLKDRKDLLKSEDASAGANAAGGSNIPGVPPMLAPPSGGPGGNQFPEGLPPGVMEQIQKQMEAQAKGAANKVEAPVKDAVKKVEAQVGQAIEKVETKIDAVNDVLKTAPPKPAAPKVELPKVTTPKAAAPAPKAKDVEAKLTEEAKDILKKNTELPPLPGAPAPKADTPRAATPKAGDVKGK